MAVGFVWGFLADLIGTTAAGVDGLDALVRLTPFAQDHAPAPDSTAGDMVGTLAVSLGFIALMGVLAWLLFRRADVKRGPGGSGIMAGTAPSTPGGPMTVLLVVLAALWLATCAYLVVVLRQIGAVRRQLEQRTGQDSPSAVTLALVVP